jgi:hypothetical protein
MTIHISAKWRKKRTEVNAPTDIRDVHDGIVGCGESRCDMLSSVASGHQRAIRRLASHYSTWGGF